MVDAATQSDPLCIFSIRESLENLKGLLGVRVNLKKFKSSKDADSDIEDYIIDRLLSEKLIIGKNTVFNPWLKPLFVDDQSFYIREGKLVCNVSPLYTNILERCKEDKFLSICMKRLNNTILDVVQNVNVYFNAFNKLKYNGPLSFTQGFALFVFWFSQILQKQISGFILNFFVLLYLNINVSCNECDVNLYIVDNYINNHKYPEIQGTEKLYQLWLDEQATFYINPTELVGLFSDYLKRNNFQEFCNAIYQ